MNDTDTSETSVPETEPKPVIDRRVVCFAVRDLVTNAVVSTGVIRVDRLATLAGAGQAVIDTSSVPGTVTTRSHVYDPTTKQLVARVATLAEIKAVKLIELSRKCGNAITRGFTSSALSTPGFYRANWQQQNNISASAQSTKGGMHWVQAPLAKSAGEGWTFSAHTQAQAQIAHDDFVSHRDTHLSLLIAFKAEVAAASTTDAVNAIVWPKPTGGVNA